MIIQFRGVKLLVSESVVSFTLRGGVSGGGHRFIVVYDLEVGLACTVVGQLNVTLLSLLTPEAETFAIFEDAVSAEAA